MVRPKRNKTKQKKNSTRHLDLLSSKLFFYSWDCVTCSLLCVVTLWLVSSLKEWIIVRPFCLSHTYYYNTNCRLILLYGKIFMFSLNKTYYWRNWGIVRLKHSSMEKEMEPHSSILAWKIPRTEEPGRLQSMGSRGLGHNWATSLTFWLFYLQT